MMPTTLLILSAGQGSPQSRGFRAGGVGPNGEYLVDYSIHDALEAGFDKVVFVVRRHMVPMFNRRFGARLSGKAEVVFAHQEFDSLPTGFIPPAMRLRPYGTVHAMLAAGNHIREPFAVINADDYYGKEAFGLMIKSLRTLRSTGEASMVGYRLKNTVSEYGHVTRGICRVDGQGKLLGIEETNWIIPRQDGSIIDLQSRRVLDPKARVSMNFWGFTPWLFDLAENCLATFLKTLPQDALKEEYPLPVMVDALIRENKLQVNVLPTEAVWFGVAHYLDRALVSGKLKSLHAQGEYPASLQC